MTDLRETAWRIATALHTAKDPEPLIVDLWGQSPVSAAYLVELVIEECSDAGVELAKVEIDPCVGVALRRPSTGPSWIYRDTTIEVNRRLFQRVEFYRCPR